MLLKTTLQVPLPATRRMSGQLTSAPVITTVPVGVAPVPLTVTPTTTVWPGVDELGTSPVMSVVEAGFGVAVAVGVAVFVGVNVGVRVGPLGVEVLVGVEVRVGVAVCPWYP